MRRRLGAPERHAYGPTPVEQLDVYRTSRPGAPINIYIHGGAWRVGQARDYGYPAELFVNAGAHYTARSAEGEIMAVLHRRLPIEGVQFHPESYLTPAGPRILRAFLRRCGRRPRPAREVVR